jgi:hypothetical protein
MQGNQGGSQPGVPLMGLWGVEIGMVGTGLTAGVNGQ